MIISHPNMTLLKHLRDVYNGALSIYRSNKIYQNDKEILKYICYFHDFGKCSTYFQKYINNERVNNHKLTYHSEMGANFAYYYAKEVLKWNRGECFMLYWAIIQHHGNLKNYIDVKQETHLNSNETLKIYNSIYENKDKIIEIYNDLGVNITDKVLINFKDFLIENIYLSKSKHERGDYMRYRYLYSLMIFADIYSAITKEAYKYNKSNYWHSGMIDIYKNKRFANSNNNIDDIREECFKEAMKILIDNPNHSIYSLNAPTGSGKTLASIACSTTLKEYHNLDRIIYCLPFTSIIDQNDAVLNDILLDSGLDNDSNIKLTHHHLSDFTYKYNNDKYNELDNRISNFYYKNWESEMIITTFHQLLNTLFKNNKSVIYRTSKLKDSVIIFDEVQTIPHKYWKVIKKLMIELTEVFNCKLIFMSATMPLIFSEEREEIFELLKSKEKIYKSLNRTMIDISLLAEGIYMKDLCNHVVDNLKDGKILMIMNTIRSSIELYDTLKSKIDTHKFVYLSTNIPPIERMNRIEYIKESNDPMIVISTQLVEAGVDIDMDVVYRDFAPLDSIFQASGRCNRNANRNEISKVIIFKLIDEAYNGNDVRYFYEYIYGNDLLCTWTLDILRNKPNIINESEFFSLSNEYYRKINNNSSNEVSMNILDNIKKLRMKSVSDEFALIDDDEKIPVIIMIDDRAERLYRDYMSAKKFNNIVLKDRLFKKLSTYIVNLRIDALKKIKLYENERYLYVIDRDMFFAYYDIETGVILKDDKSLIL